VELIMPFMINPKDLKLATQLPLDNNQYRKKEDRCQQNTQFIEGRPVYLLENL
jgi:hypothetical protein